MTASGHKSTVAGGTAAPGSGGRLGRRQFLSSTVAGLPLILPSGVLRAAGGRPPPSERINVGVIGNGSQGTGHVRVFASTPEAQVVGVCDPFRSKREAARDIVNGVYSATRGKGEYEGCADYADFRELVARPDLDAVAIASPENWHALHALAAVKSGKDVYCEKALSLTVAEGRAVCEGVRRHLRVLQVGTQQRSNRDFRYACELARNGYLGRVHTVEVGVPGGRSLPNAPAAPVPPGLDYDLWLGPARYTPYNAVKCSFNWYFMYDYCVGWIQSWGVHHIDIALWGAPALAASTLSVEGTAAFPDDGLADTSVTWLVKATSPEGVTLSFADNGRLAQGCRFIGDRGWVLANRGGLAAEPASLLTQPLGPGSERLRVSRNHHGDFLACVRSRRDPVSTVESGHAATVLTIVSDIATRLGRPLTWDWAAERFVNDPGANRYLRRPMRAPWHV